MLTWMHVNRELVKHVTYWNNTKCNIVMLKLMISYMGHGGSPIVEYNPQISRYDRAVQEVEKLLVPNLGA